MTDQDVIAEATEKLAIFTKAGWKGDNNNSQAGWQDFAQSAWQFYDAAPRLVRDLLALLTEARKEIVSLRELTQDRYSPAASAPAGTAEVEISDLNNEWNKKALALKSGTPVSSALESEK